MGRQLVLCFDGTNNKYSNKADTNVVKLYQMLDPSSSQCLRYYQPGIGTMAPVGIWGKTKTWFIEKLDLAIAWLLEEHVCDGYRYLMRYYEPGDEVFIFGFSRGAYTARVVAAMVHKVGLLTRGNDELIPFVWDTFKREKRRDVYEGFKATFSRSVDIYMIGIWDTVSSVGWMWNPTHLPYSANNPSVRYVRHAVSIDERRAYFPQNMWTGTSTDRDAVKQVWFPGVHCDVGGGYKEFEEAGLSKGALQWMLREAESLGLKIDQAIKAKIIPAKDSKEYAAPNPLGQMHQSLSGLWWIAEVVPKLYHDPARGFRKRLQIHLARRRFIPDQPPPVAHRSMETRKQDPKQAYDPKNMPQNYTVVD